MNGRRPHTYHFATRQQWSACSIPDGLVSAGDGGRAIVKPVAPLHADGEALNGPARAPLVFGDGSVLWSGGGGTLFQWSPGGGPVTVLEPPNRIAGGRRMVLIPEALVVLARGRLTIFDPEQFSALWQWSPPSGSVTDIAAGPGGSVLALVAGADQQLWQICHDGRAARLAMDLPPQPLKAIAYGASAGVVAALPESGSRLHIWTLGTNEALPYCDLGRTVLCFKPDDLCSAGPDHILVTGVHGEEEHPLLLTLTSSGGFVGRTPLAARAAGVAERDGTVAIATASGMLRLSRRPFVPDGSGSVTMTLTTPALRTASLEREKLWRSARLELSLPQGCFAELSWCALDPDGEAALAHEGGSIGALTSIPPGNWSAPAVVQARGTKDGPVTVSCPLTAAGSPCIIIRISLSAPAGSELPGLLALDVDHGGRTLIDDLPALYRGQEQESEEFLRAFLGVIGSSTQDLDRRIEALAGLLDPSSAPPAWLDELARWTGLPWHSEIDDGRKRRLLSEAPAILRHFGSRRGLETVLGCLFPGDVPAYRVIDYDSEFDPAMLGGAAPDGSRLPAMLPAAAAGCGELGPGVLGRLHLAAADAGPAWGESIVDIRVPPEELPWLAELLQHYVPAGVAVRVIREAAVPSGDVPRLDGGAALRPPPPLALGNGHTMQGRLAGAGRLRLGPQRLSPGTRLG